MMWPMTLDLDKSRVLLVDADTKSYILESGVEIICNSFLQTKSNNVHKEWADSIMFFKLGIDVNIIGFDLNLGKKPLCSHNSQ